MRYADDNIVGFQSEMEARRFLRELQERLEKFGLTLHPKKTRLLAFGRRAQQHYVAGGEEVPESFDFLGFTHCNGVSSRGTYQVKRLTMKSRMRKTLSAIRKRLMERRHEPIPRVGRWLRSVIRGYSTTTLCPGTYGGSMGFERKFVAHGVGRYCAVVNDIE